MHMRRLRHILRNDVFTQRTLGNRETLFRTRLSTRRTRQDDIKQNTDIDALNQAGVDCRSDERRALCIEDSGNMLTGWGTVVRELWGVKNEIRM
jgi:hypothetical protein